MRMVHFPLCLGNTEKLGAVKVFWVFCVLCSLYPQFFANIFELKLEAELSARLDGMRTAKSITTKICIFAMYPSVGIFKKALVDFVFFSTDFHRN